MSLKSQASRLRPSHMCAAAGCKERVPTAYFMCRAHWYRVPVSVRAAIWDAYRRYERDPSDEHLRALRRVQEQAKEALS